MNILKNKELRNIFLEGVRNLATNSIAKESISWMDRCNFYYGDNTVILTTIENFCKKEDIVLKLVDK